MSAAAAGAALGSSAGPASVWAEAPGWYRFIVLAWLAGFVVLGAGVVFFALLWAQRRMLRKTCRVEISNLGNVRSRYGLHADDPIGALDFRFIINGADLLLQPGGPPTTGMGVVIPNAAASGNGRELVPANGAGTRLPARRSAASGGALADLMQSVGQLLPGSLGSRARQTGSQARQAQYTMDHAQRLSSWVGPGQPEAAAAVGDAGVASTSTAGAQHEWACTPFVEPGETLTVDLLIASRRWSPTQRYSFRVASAALDLQDATTVIEAGNVEIRGLSGLRLALTALIVGVLTVIAFLAMRWLLLLLGVLA